MSIAFARRMAAARERHRPDARVEIRERHPHRDRLLGVERPVELILMPRRVPAAGLLEQRLVVVEANAADTEEIRRCFAKRGANTNRRAASSVRHRLKLCRNADEYVSRSSIGRRSYVPLAAAASRNGRYAVTSDSLARPSTSV